MAKITKHTGVEARGQSIRITFRWRTERHRETLDMRPTPANLKAAARIRAAIQGEIRQGVFNYAEHFPDSKTVKKLGLVTTAPKPKQTFQDVAVKWLQASSDLSAGTLKKYRSELRRYWLPEFGDRAITEIKYSDLAAYVGLINWPSPKTRNNALIPLRQVFEMAFMDDLIDTNPALKLKNQKYQKNQPDPLTLEEVEKILEYMRSMFDEQVSNYFEFAFFTGLRTEEIIALKWSDIELNPQRLVACIQRAQTMGEEKETKTNKIRHIDLNSRARDVLSSQKQHTFPCSEYVFNNPFTGKPWNDNGKAQRIRYWNPTLDRLGIRHRRAYETRHTYATMLLMSGTNPAYAASQMGHSIQVFFTVYAKWINTATQHGERAKVEGFIVECGEQTAPKTQKSAPKGK